MRPFSALTLSFKATKSLQSLFSKLATYITGPKKEITTLFFQLHFTFSILMICHRIKNHVFRKLNSEIYLRSDGTKIDDSLMEMEDANVHHETLVGDKTKKYLF